MTLYNINFSKKINSVINNNAIYVLRTFYNIKCHGVIRRQIVRRALLSLRFSARDVVEGDDQFGGRVGSLEIHPLNTKKCQVVTNQLLSIFQGTPDRTRTYTSETLDPKSSASTNSATGAICGCKGTIFFLFIQIFRHLFCQNTAGSLNYRVFTTKEISLLEVNSYIGSNTELCALAISIVHRTGTETYTPTIGKTRREGHSGAATCDITHDGGKGTLLHILDKLVGGTIYATIGEHTYGFVPTDI